MPNGARHYSFTCNNYSDEDIEAIRKSFDDSRVNYVIFGKEVAKSGTPHLQGQISFNKQTSIKKALKILGIVAHFSPTRDIPKSIEYCKKDGQWEDFGTPPTVTASGTPSGARSDTQSNPALAPAAPIAGVHHRTVAFPSFRRAQRGVSGRTLPPNPPTFGNASPGQA